MAARNITRTINFYFNGEGAEQSIKELQAEYYQLRRTINKLPPASKEFVEATKQYQAVGQRLSHLRAEVRGVESGFVAMLKNMSGVQAFTVANLAAEGLSKALAFIAQKAGEVINQNALLSDEMANIQKTTGLARDEVASLVDQLLQLDTRTSRTELNRLASDAGKLGITGSKNILEFVKAADQINVALGEDLGEDAIKNIAKMNDVFRETTRLGVEKAMLATGSAINSLGQAGTAAEGYMVDFTRRLAGVANQSDITISNVLGMAATLDELGQTSEVSSTALSQLFIKMQTESETYAKIAGLNVQEFNRMLKEDANEAFVQFLEGLNNNSDGMRELAQNFSGLGIDGTRAIGVISALAQNTDKLREKQQFASAEFQKGSSITAEFTARNETLAGAIEKLQKRFQTAIVNSEFVMGLEKVVIGFEKLTRIPLSEKLEDERQQFRALGAQLLNSNMKLDERRKLVGRMQQMQPGFLKGLEVEKLSNQDIATALQKVNTEYLNRIVLSQKQEEINALLEEQAYQQGISAERNLELDQKLLDLQEKYGLQIDFNATREQQALEAIGQLREKVNPNVEAFRDQATIAIKSIEALMIQSEVSSTLSEKASTKAAKMEEYRLKLAKELGVVLEENTEATTQEAAIPALPEGPVEGGAPSPGLVPDQKQQEQELQRLREQAAKLQEEIARSLEEQQLLQEDADTRALMAIDQRYADQLQRLKEFRQQKAITDEEYEAQARQIDEARQLEREQKQREFAGRDKQLRDELRAQIDQEELSRWELEKEQINQKYSELIRMAEEYGLDAVYIEKLRAQQTAAIRAVEMQEQKEANAKTLEDEQKLYEARQQLAQNFNSILTGIMNLSGQQGAEMSGFQRMLALIQIGIDTATAMSSVISNNAKTSLTPVDYAIRVSAGIGIVLANMAKAKQVLAQAKDVKPPSFFQGGDTGTANGSLGADRFGPIAGVVHENEYVIPARLRNDPEVVMMEKVIEAKRTGKSFFQGGESGTARAPAAEPAADMPPGQTADLSALLAEMRAMRSEMAGWKSRLRAYVVQVDQEEADRDLEEIRSTADLQ